MYSSEMHDIQALYHDPEEYPDGPSTYLAPDIHDSSGLIYSSDVSQAHREVLSTEDPIDLSGDLEDFPDYDDDPWWGLDPDRLCQNPYHSGYMKSFELCDGPECIIQSIQQE